MLLMKDEARLLELIKMAQEFDISLDNLETRSRLLDTRAFKRWAERLSIRLRNKKSNDVP